MTREAFRIWLEKYLRPQERGNPELIKEIFAEGATYCWGPFNESRHGLEAIYDHHKNALSHQADLQYDYEVLAVTEEHGIARFHLRLKELMEGEPNEYDGIFVVQLNQENKCTLFQEWYHSITRSD